MSPAEEYEKKLISGENAASLVKSGDWVDYGFCAGHSFAVDRALANRAAELRDVKVRGGVTLRMPAIFQIDNPGDHFTWVSWHFTGVDRKIYEMGCGYYTPMRYSELPRYYLENVDPIGVAICQVTPVNRDGFFNLGPQVSHQRAVFTRAKTKIVETNPHMPFCHGDKDAFIHISEIDHVVEEPNQPLPQLVATQPTAVDEQVARFIVEEIPDGACLQLGIGGMPNAVGMLIARSDLKDLGVHTEMYVDAFVDMAEAGKINGSRKNIDRGRQVFTFAAGTQRLYDYLDNNRDMRCTTVDRVVDIRTVSQLDNFISINNAVEIDLFGQVNSESNGVKHISGTGGQLDFVIGAYLSKGGKSFICLSSTYNKSGAKKTRIVPTLAPGTIVTDSRTCTHWVVTEFGKVNLKGKNTWEKAEALISVAHPDFRDELIKAADEMKIWRERNKR